MGAANSLGEDLDRWPPRLPPGRLELTQNFCKVWAQKVWTRRCGHQMWGRARVRPVAAKASGKQTLQTSSRPELRKAISKKTGFRGGHTWNAYLRWGHRCQQCCAAPGVSIAGTQEFSFSDQEQPAAARRRRSGDSWIPTHPTALRVTAEQLLLTTELPLPTGSALSTDLPTYTAAAARMPGTHSKVVKPASACADSLSPMLSNTSRP